MSRVSIERKLFAAVAISLPAFSVHANVDLIATSSLSATYQDLSNQTAGLLENGIPGNRLGGMGSAIAYAGGDTFLSLPDRGPNATPFDSNLDDTVSYINRFETFNLRLLGNVDFDPSNASSLPFILTPTLRTTTLLSSLTPLVYGTGAGLTENNGSAIGSGVPALNATHHTHYFTGRSDNFDPSKPSTNPNNARFDTEGMRVSNDGLTVFISDEYGPALYQFDRLTGIRIRSFQLPASFAVTNLSPVGNTEISNNTSGRVANKGMEGLAITPDGKTLVGMMQSPLIQDGGTNAAFTRIVTIDIASGAVTHQYAYPLDNEGSASKPKFTAVSEIIAVNNHQFLVDERDGGGFEGNTAPPIEKNLYLVDLNGATDVSNTFGQNNLNGKQLQKTLWLNIVSVLNAHGFDDNSIPSKIEGLAFGQDITLNGSTRHTLYVTNDNDFLTTSGGVDNPNRWFVFAFSDSDLPGLVKQPVQSRTFLDCALDNLSDGCP
jgi:hypothetical protein